MLPTLPVSIATATTWKPTPGHHHPLHQTVPVAMRETSKQMNTKKTVEAYTVFPNCGTVPALAMNPAENTVFQMVTGIDGSHAQDNTLS
jgi:hypothetical protein